MQPSETSSRPLGLLWIYGPYPVAAMGLARILRRKARVHIGGAPAEENPSLTVLTTNNMEDLQEGWRRVREANPEFPVLVFGLRLDLPLAWAALRSGARGYIYAGMPPEQITRAVELAKEGEIVAPRKLLEYLMTGENLGTLSARQQEILELVSDGLSNAQIAQRLFLSESTVKQHLRSAYKTLHVRNRIQAIRLVRNGT